MDDSTTERIDAYRALRAELLRDPHRPLWHLTSPEHGDAMPFDPNGALHWRGRHHLFHIFQRTEPDTGTVVHAWGHLSSIDLLHWRHHPTALDVAPGDPDRSIFSGNAFLDRDGTPVLCYHGVGIGNSLARARDPETDPGLQNWDKHLGNPIVPIPKEGDPGHGVYESWDPHAWVEGDVCHACFGGRVPAHFQGPDWDHLVHTGPFLEGDTLSDDEDDVSCPDFFAIGDRHALVAIRRACAGGPASGMERACAPPGKTASLGPEASISPPKPWRCPTAGASSGDGCWIRARTTRRAVGAA